MTSTIPKHCIYDCFLRVIKGGLLCKVYAPKLSEKAGNSDGGRAVDN